jgi:hypothetical protein
MEPANPDPVCMGLNRGKSNNYFGLAGQAALPMIVTAIGSNTNCAPRFGQSSLLPAAPLSPGPRRRLNLTSGARPWRTFANWPLVESTRLGPVAMAARLATPESK